jgi:serine phosphatase RsbU (regulator of sigma subunit)
LKKCLSNKTIIKTCSGGIFLTVIEALLMFKLQVGCIFLTGLVAIPFFSIKGVTNLPHKIFRYLIIVKFVYLVFDIITVYTVNNLNTVSEILNKTVHIIFISCLCLYVYLVYLYTRQLIYNSERKAHTFIYGIPLILAVFTVVAAPLYYIETPQGNYSAGPGATAVYCIVGVYLVLMLYMTIRHWNKIDRDKRQVILIAILAKIFISLLQLFMPTLLISSLGTTIITLAIYLTLENPDRVLKELFRAEKLLAEEHTLRERAEKELIVAELNIATEIQASMLPNKFPAFPHRSEFDLYATMNPAKEVGGDFYDFFMVNENTLAVVIADVSGKGVPAALFMVIAKTLIKSNAESGKSPKEVFETTNNILCENNDSGFFVTAFISYINVQTGKCVFVNAAHNAPMIKKSNGDFVYLESTSHMMLAGLEGSNYSEDEMVLSQGDVLYLYTDGVTEAMNPSEDLFSDERLLETINKHKSQNIMELLSAIKDEIDHFADGAEQADDITMLALEIK